MTRFSALTSSYLLFDLLKFEIDGLSIIVLCRLNNGAMRH